MFTSEFLNINAFLKNTKSEIRNIDFKITNLEISEYWRNS